MNSTMTRLHAWPVWKNLGCLDVSTVFEDSSTGERADDYCRALALELGQQCEVRHEKWPLSELRLPELRGIAAKAAGQAGLILISVHHAQSLPEEIKVWIDLWLRSKGHHPVVLLALFDPLCEGDSSSIQTYLRKVAKRGNAEFVVESMVMAGVDDW